MATSTITEALTAYVQGIGSLVFYVVPILMLASVSIFGLFFGIRFGIKWLRKALGGKV